METIIITTQDNNTYKFTPAIKNASGDFSPCDFNDSVFAEGSTCKVFLALAEDKRRYLIKQYKPGFTGDESYETISKIKIHFNKQGDNYLLGDIFTGAGCFENSNEEPLNYKVFEYREGMTLLPHSGEKSIFSDINMVYTTLLDFIGYLNALKHLHAEIDGESYLNCDIKLDNSFAVNINQRIVQPIDMDSVRSKREIVKAIENGVPYDQLIPTTAKYYSNDDVKALCELSGEELQRCVYILDTTAAVKMLSKMLVGNLDYDTSKDDEVLDKNEALQTALYHFFEKGLWNDFSERFSNVDEMIQQLSAIVAAISDSLPTTVLTEKLKAIYLNPTINQLRDSYIKRHGLNNKATRKDIFIHDLLNEIDKDILPNVQKKDSDKEIEESKEKAPFETLLNENKNYLLLGEGGQGKSTSILNAYLKNIQNLESKELYIYVPLAEYSEDQTIEDFVSDKTGFSFDRLIANKENRIVLFFDAMDEMQPFRDSNREEKELFLKAFFQKLNASFSNITMLITSRAFSNITEVAKESSFNVASFQFLDEYQVEKYLNLDQFSYNAIKKNTSLRNLLTNPFMLNIYKRLKPSISDPSNIKTESDILDRFFEQMYERKHKITIWREKNKRVFNRLMHSAAEAAFSQRLESNIYFLKDARNIEQLYDDSICFSPIIELYKTKNGERIVFSHEIYRDYFAARYLLGQILRMFKKNKLEAGDIQILSCRCSYQTLLFVSQLLNSIQESSSNVKEQLEKLFKKTLDFLDNIDWWSSPEISKIFDDDMPPDRLTLCAWIDADIDGQKSNRPIITLLRIIAFLYVDLSNFNFGEYFKNTSLPTGTFSQCLELERIILPSPLQGIEGFAFNGCRNLSEICLPPAFVEDRDDFESFEFNKFSYCEKLQEIKVPHGTSELPIDMFDSCYSLTTVYLPITIKEISSCAFKCCYSLKQIIYAGTKDQWSNVKKSGSWRYLAGIFDVLCSDGLYDEGSFLENGLEVSQINNELCVISVGHCVEQNIIIPENVDRIKEGAFSNCDDIVSASTNAQIIENSAFSYCKSLSDIIISSRLIKVGSSAFHNLRSGVSVNFNGNLKDWCNIVFADAGANPCNNYGSLSFENCLVTSVKFDSFTAEIRPNVFSGCMSLKKVFISKEIKKIGKGAFGGCSNLTHIRFFGSIDEWEKIEKNCEHEGGLYYYSNWYDKSGIYCVICNDGTIEIPNDAGKNLRLELNPDGKSYSLSGIIFEDVSHFSKYDLESEITIPHYYKGLPITKISDYALQDTPNISLYIPNTVKEIGEKSIGCSAFYYLGTKSEWRKILKANNITEREYVVRCFDGDINLNNSK